jgi:hypothetical protein
MESFQLTRTDIHRDLASELKQIKVLFYLDDVNSYEKGPLYVIPGTHNIYDKYSSSISENVGWPTPQKGPGSGFCVNSDYMQKNIPKTYMYSNADKIILFNLNLLHGSDGNVIDPSILRRCIGMTLMCVDRSNETLMKKIDNFYASYNVNNLNSPAYEYCKKNNLTSWLKHFYIPTRLNHSFSHFIVNKTFMNEIGYFDEKLLGFGWEDSDFCMRYYEKTGNVIGVIETTAIKNLNSIIKHKNIRNVWDKYSLINREYYEKKYEYPLAESYKCGQRFLPNENPYPLETYYLNNKNNL